MSQFKPGDRVNLAGVRMHKGIFVTPMSPKQIKAVKATGQGTVYDVQFLDAEGNPHVIENVPEQDVEKA